LSLSITSIVACHFWFSFAAFFIYKIIKANKDRQLAKEEKKKMKQDKKKK